jgi:excisionase family DNA binding protein
MSQPDAERILEDAPELMTVVEVARWLRVHQRTVYRLVRQEDLPHVRVGRGLRFTRAEVEAWMRRRSEG